MRLFADENIEQEIVTWLRGEGHDVLWGAESTPAMGDEEMIRRAQAERRVLVTNDLDFGELVFRRARVTDGILLLRFEDQRVAWRVETLRRHWPTIQRNLAGRFVVVTATRVRVRPIPGIDLEQSHDQRRER